ncbi:hypothetical protein B0T20DRAFT_210834 [Sordaria brevicollis]|uniref:CCHC-type domain-containing protein n=1 Tax=Sordaria brevicollis TaxID=83679 RepID=A0AAE0PEM1_SORBR|nr:hypothetical protein B0T20DRAFT_210834 [Sordaria brevicollis]
MGYREEMIAYAGRLGVQRFGDCSLQELSEHIESDPEQTTPRTKLYAYMTWLSDHLQKINNSDENVFGREIAAWCSFVNEVGFDKDNVVGTFEEWVHEHSEVERSSARRLSMAELEVKKFYRNSMEAPQLASENSHDQPSLVENSTSEQFSPANEASEAPHVGGFGHIHPDRLKMSEYGDSNREKGEVIDLDNWQRPIVNISSDEEGIPKPYNDLSFLTGANRMLFGDDEATMNTDLKETKRGKKKSKTLVVQPGPTSGQAKNKNKRPCGRCGVPGHYHLQCPTNLDPSFDKSPPEDYTCNFCKKSGDHYATVCKKNMNPTSLNQQRQLHARRQYHSISRRDRSRSPLRESKDRHYTRRERSPYRVSKDRHHYDRERSPYRVSETRYHHDRDCSRERSRSRDRYRRSRSRSKYRSPSPPRRTLRRRERHQNNKMYRPKRSSPEPNFEEPDSSPLPQVGGLDYDDGLKPMPFQPYRSLLSRPTDIKIRGRGNSLYYDDNGGASMKPSVYGDGDLMSRKRRRSATPAPHQDDHVDRSTVDEQFSTELTELIATTTISPRPQAPMRSRLSEVFKNDLRQPSWAWATEPTANITLTKHEPVPDVVRQPSPPVELGITEKRIDGYRAPQYHPAILSLFKNRKNIWIHKIDKIKRPQASSFFSHEDSEDNNMDGLVHPDAAIDTKSAQDTVMTDAEPVAPSMNEADAVDASKTESEPVAMSEGHRHVDKTSMTDVVMEDPLKTHSVHHDKADSSIRQHGEDSRVDMKPADDIVMNDAEPLDVPEANATQKEVDVSAIVDEIIADMGLPEAANITPELVKKECPPTQPVAQSETIAVQETILVQGTVNATPAESLDMAFPEAAETVPMPVDKSPPVESTTSSEIIVTQEKVLVQETANGASPTSADIVPTGEPNHASKADDNEHAAPEEATQHNGDSISFDKRNDVSSDTVIKDVIYVKTDPERAQPYISQPEEQADNAVPDGLQTQ